jgi:5-methylcytosine-specific restriction endonuclease McrA
VMVRQIGQQHRQVDMRAAQPIAKKADNFYHSVEWTVLIASVIKERGRRCEECGRIGTRIFGDHIRELRDGGAPLDRRNLRLLCGSCHSLKTAAERAKRMAVRY